MRSISVYKLSMSNASLNQSCSFSLWTKKLWASWTMMKWHHGQSPRGQKANCICSFQKTQFTVISAMSSLRNLCAHVVKGMVRQMCLKHSSKNYLSGTTKNNLQNDVSFTLAMPQSTTKIVWNNHWVHQAIFLYWCTIFPWNEPGWVHVWDLEKNGQWDYWNTATHWGQHKSSTVHIPLIAKDFENCCNLQFEDVSELRRCCQIQFQWKW